MQNLNELTLQNFGVSKSNVRVHVYFKNLAFHLNRHIEAADIVVGCVAWLTSAQILDALSRKTGVSIIVQKEDWLRPDVDAKGNWKTRQKARYDKLPSELSRLDKGLNGTELSMMSYCGDPMIEAVRCVGNRNLKKLPACPLMHHKFIVFCRNLESNVGQWRNYGPFEVWTGSFNFTKNAGSSFENAVVLTDTAIARAYFGEWAQIAALSERLNWESEWVRPEWHVGS